MGLQRPLPQVGKSTLRLPCRAIAGLGTPFPCSCQPAGLNKVYNAFCDLAVGQPDTGQPYAVLPGRIRKTESAQATQHLLRYTDTAAICKPSAKLSAQNRCLTFLYQTCLIHLGVTDGTELHVYAFMDFGCIGCHARDILWSPVIKIACSSLS